MDPYRMWSRLPVAVQLEMYSASLRLFDVLTTLFGLRLDHGQWRGYPAPSANRYG